MPTLSGEEVDTEVVFGTTNAARLTSTSTLTSKGTKVSLACTSYGLVVTAASIARVPTHVKCAFAIDTMLSKQCRGGRYYYGCDNGDGLQLHEEKRRIARGGARRYRHDARVCDEMHKTMELELAQCDK